MKPFLMIQADMADVQTVVDTATATGVQRETFWSLATQGGWIMLVLVVLLALAIYISIERYLALRQAVKTDDDNNFTPFFMSSITRLASVSPKTAVTCISEPRSSQR